MAYDERLADRLRAMTADVLGADTTVVEKKMFGGLALMVDGNMACGVYQDAVLVRVDPATSADVLAEPSVRPFDGPRPCRRAGCSSTRRASPTILSSGGGCSARRRTPGRSRRSSRRQWPAAGP